MDTTTFLRKVWPLAGTYLIAIQKTWKNDAGEVISYLQHFAHTSVDAAANHAQALAFDREAPCDVYFALATVKEDLTALSKAQREAAGKKVRGIHKTTKHDNTDAVRCFWLDIDVKAKPDAYPTQKEAIAALQGFCKAMRLPRPMVGTSGYGLHVYWPLSDALDGDKWAHYAGILKQLAKSWGLRADPSRTADRASVLRPVGTLNLKDKANPRPVQLAVDGDVQDTMAFLKHLALLAETADLPAEQASALAPTLLGARPDQPGDAAQINAAAASGIGSGGDYTEPSAKLVVAKCLQLHWQATHQGEVDEPQWYDMVGCMRHAENGDKAVHLLSLGHPGYSKENTDRKILQHVQGGYGPTTCETFETHRPGGCHGCPHKGKVKSPLVLGRQLKHAEAPVVQLTASTGEVVELALPDPRPPFKRTLNKATGQSRIVMLMKDEDGDYEDEIYEHDIYPSRIVRDERTGNYRFVVNRWIPQEGWAEFDIPGGMIYDRRSLSKLFGDMGVYPDLGKVEHLAQYMIGYIKELQARSASSVVYAQMGWRGDTKFILPDLCIGPAGAETIQPSGNVRSAFELNKYETRKGDLAVWKDIVSIYERPELVGFQFAFGTAFAAPLMALTSYYGMIVSVIGRGGAGKSTALYCANSVWGHTWFGGVDKQHGTVKAFFGKLGVLNNLPATYDEITNASPEELSDLAYTITKGQGRQALNQDGTMRENVGNWATMVLATANASIHEKLALYKSDASAESIRVFEYAVPTGTLTKQEADANFDRLKDHFGVAGPVYAEALVRNLDWVKGRIHHWKQAVEQTAKVTSAERFWSAGVACVLAGFELANRCGLTNANLDNLFGFATDTISRMRGAVVTNVRDPLGAVTEYLNANARRILILKNDPDKGVAMTALEPSDGLRVRVELWNSRMYLDRADFRKFCATQQMDAKTVEQELRALGLLKANDRRVVLGKGTQYAMLGGQTYAWVLDTSHPMMSGVPALASAPGSVDSAAATA